jgi:hypothetical protein
LSGPDSLAVKCVTYEDAQNLALSLARRLEAEIPDLLESASFMAIPRGGYVVLGLLSYALRLRREQFGQLGSTLVLVDDCLLSGLRTRNFLANLSHQKIVLAHLLSVPEARQAVLRQEPRVLKCVAAENLGTLQALDSEAQAMWRERFGDERYWLGFSEEVLFPWSEPDHVIWNAREERVEPGWHKIPPRDCLKHLCNLSIPVTSMPGAEIRLHGEARWRLEEDAVALWETQSDKVYRLEEVAAAMFKASLAFGRRKPALEYLVGQYNAPPEEVESDFDEFLVLMQKRRLLTIQSEE